MVHIYISRQTSLFIGLLQKCKMSKALLIMEDLFAPSSPLEIMGRLLEYGKEYTQYALCMRFKIDTETRII